MLRKIFLVITLNLIINYPTYALENNLGKTPVMGWASWNNFRVDINETMIKEMADALVSSGLKNLGYTYVNIDDGWFGGRDSKDKLTAHPERFPQGMKALADYIHSKGLKAGIYSDVGIDSCGSIFDNDVLGQGLGFYGHEQADANQYFIDWGYDYIKVDWCGGQKLGLDAKHHYMKIGDAILNTKKEVFYSICNWSFPGAWALNTSNMWRTTEDIKLGWESFTAIADLNNESAPFAGPGHFNDADMLEVGRGMTYEEDKSHFSLWAIMAAPLILGNDIRSMSAETKSIITNEEVIRVDQDPAGIQGRKIYSEQGLEVWMKPLGGLDGKEKAVLLFNRTTSPADITVNWQSIRLGGLAVVRDLWRKIDLGGFYNSYTALDVPAHGVVLLKVTASEDRLNV